MSSQEQAQLRGRLLTELSVFIRLRWLAALVVLLAALLARFHVKAFSWYDSAAHIAGVGATILFYNIALWLILRRVNKQAHPQRPMLISLAWFQIILDLACLTTLNLMTGGIDSPLKGFFVFHMLFASLLLPRLMAFGATGVAVLMMAAGLWMTGQWPATERQSAGTIAWALMLLVTVWLANGITLNLRRQSRRLFRQNRRIRAMARELRKQQRAMVQQEKMAAAGRMAAGVAHEIANPLASMDGLLQLIARNPDKVRSGSVATLREQVARINQIVRRMTTFSHPGDGQWLQADLNAIIEKALEILRFDPRWKQLRVDRQLAADLPAVRMLPEGMQQVIINMIVNALDAMEQTSEPALLIRTCASGDWCTLEITDNGPGFSDQARKHLFEPFFTTKPVGKGTGLGLSIAYSIIRQHGGQIAAHNVPGQGARFTIRLPLSAPAAGNHQSMQPGRSTSQTETLICV